MAASAQGGVRLDVQTHVVAGQADFPGRVPGTLSADTTLGSGPHRDDRKPSEVHRQKAFRDSPLSRGKLAASLTDQGACAPRHWLRSPTRHRRSWHRGFSGRVGQGPCEGPPCLDRGPPLAPQPFPEVDIFTLFLWRMGNLRTCDEFPRQD